MGFSLGDLGFCFADLCFLYGVIQLYKQCAFRYLATLCNWQCHDDFIAGRGMSDTVSLQVFAGGRGVATDASVRFLGAPAAPDRGVWPGTPPD